MENKGKILVINHYTELSGVTDKYFEYLINQGQEVYKVSHPLRFNDLNTLPTLVLYKKKLLRQFSRSKLSYFNLVLDFLFSVYAILRIRPAIGIGADNFDTFCFIITKKVFEIPTKVIYYGSDFSLSRFNHQILDYIYLQLEKLCLKGASLVVSNSQRSETSRLKLGLRKEKSVIVYNSLFFAAAEIGAKQYDRNKFIYIGNLDKAHGLHDFLVNSSIEISTLVLIGSGEELDKIKTFCSSQNAVCETYKNKSIEFVHTYLKTFNGFGLAPYTEKEDWVYYSSPQKVFEYIYFGVPVIMSSYPEISLEVKDQKLGIVYDNHDFSELAKQIRDFDFTGFQGRAENFCRVNDLAQQYKKIEI